MGNQPSKSTTSSPDSVFTNYPELPPEVRLDILALAAPGPRIIVLEERKKDWISFFYISASAPTIEMLSVSQDARSVILKDWKPSFESWLGYSILFNPGRDILLFSEENMLSRFTEKATKEEGELVHFIALNPTNPNMVDKEQNFAKITFDKYDTMLNLAFGQVRESLGTLTSLEEIVFMAPNFSEEKVATLVARLDVTHTNLQRWVEKSPDPQYWPHNVVPKMPVFSMLPFKSNAKGIAKMEEELVTRRLSSRRG